MCGLVKHSVLTAFGISDSRKYLGWYNGTTASPSLFGPHINCLLTAALCAEVLPQGCYVSVPAQCVDVLWRRGPVEELKGSQVGLRRAEPSQVAA